MDSRIIDLSKYRFEKGLEDFDTAKSNIEVGKYRQIEIAEKVIDMIKIHLEQRWSQ